MGLTIAVRKVLAAAAAPLTAREVREATPGIQSPEVIGSTLFSMVRTGEVEKIQGDNGFTYVKVPGWKPKRGGHRTGQSAAPAPPATHAAAATPRTKHAPKRTTVHHPAPPKTEPARDEVHITGSPWLIEAAIQSVVDRIPGGATIVRNDVPPFASWRDESAGTPATIDPLSCVLSKRSVRLICGALLGADRELGDSIQGAVIEAVRAST